MIIETGRVLTIESEGLWVETIQRSTCSNCRVESGCGQSLMNKLGRQTGYLWVLLDGRNPADYQVGDEVRIGVPEDVVARGSLFAYCLPLMSLILVSGIAHSLWGHELFTFMAAIIGLVVGGLLVRWRAQQTRFDPRLQPVLVDDREALHFA